MKKCHDCNVEKGEFHIAGCDWEECPFCGNQLISCDCCYEILDIDPEKEPTYSEGLNDKQRKKWEEILETKGLIPYGEEKRFDISELKKEGNDASRKS